MPIEIMTNCYFIVLSESLYFDVQFSNLKVNVLIIRVIKMRSMLINLFFQTRYLLEFLDNMFTFDKLFS
jgi:hypothetical protein